MVPCSSSTLQTLITDRINIFFPNCRGAGKTPASIGSPGANVGGSFGWSVGWSVGQKIMDLWCRYGSRSSLSKERPVQIVNSSLLVTRPQNKPIVAHKTGRFSLSPQGGGVFRGERDRKHDLCI